MKDYQEKAWNWLLEEEQNSLFLTLGTGKSSWEVGEMMKKSHYKYLEIKERSEKLFRLFTDFLEVHPSLFRPDGPCQEDFKDYIEAVICHRKKKREAAGYTGHSENLLNEVNNKKIEKNLRYLKESGDSWDNDTYLLIHEFDRWNNFRILPKMIQWPSAFKRRINKKHKIYIRYLLSQDKMPDWVLEKIKERFYFKTRKAENKYYIALISHSLFKETGYFLLPIKRDEEVVNEMSKFFIYVFECKSDADAFAFKVANYRLQTSRVKLGLKYWPEYRDIVERAVNYSKVNNMDFDFRTLDNAYRPIHNNWGENDENSSDPGVSRAKTSVFYKKS